MELVPFAICTLIVIIAGCLHGSIGLGFALIAAPLLILIEPALVPGPIIAVGSILVIAMAIRERKAIRIREVSWAVFGCALGSGVGAFVLVSLPTRIFLAFFGVMLLVAVSLSLGKWKITPSPRTTFSAGIVSGIMGTTTSIGGPPMALVYQDSNPEHLRATLSAFFVSSLLFAIGGVAAAGRFGFREIELAAYLFPGTLVGYAISSYTRRFLDARYVRPIVLAFSAIAAVIILSRLFQG